LFEQTRPVPQSALFRHAVPLAATQTELLQVWPAPQSSAFVQELVHWPSRQTRPAPQCLLNWQVFAPPQSPEQVPQPPSTQKAPGQLAALWQLVTTGLPGTQVPRESHW